MLAKSLLAGTVLSVLAGGVVYYGLGEELSEKAQFEPMASQSQSAQSRPQESDVKGADTEETDIEENLSSRETLKSMMERKSAKTLEPEPEEEIEGAAVVSHKNEPEIETKEHVEAETGSVEKPKKRWLDEYLKSDKPKDPELEIEELDSKQYLDTKTTKTITTKTVTTTTETLGEGEKARRTITPMKPRATGSYKVTVNGKSVTKPLSITTDDTLSLPPTPPQTPLHMHSPQSDVYDLLMSETGKLDIPDMRDQAYLNIVDYALSKGDRNVAETVLQKLSRDELRDTARGRVAVSLAQKGQSVAAFDMLSSLEIDELEGPIRLQIIEALTLGQIASE